jgi:hypothetical protein
MQATLTYHNPPLNHIPVIGIMMCVLLFMVGTVYSHAVTKHADDALRVRECLNDKGHMQVWYNFENQHYLRLCEVQPGMFGIQVLARIDHQWQEISGFVKEKFHRLEQVERYLTNSGAVKVWPK